MWWTRTDLRLAALNAERALPVADEEGEVKEVLDRLPKVVRVDDEFEEVDFGVVVLQDPLELVTGRMHVRKYYTS